MRMMSGVIAIVCGVLFAVVMQADATAQEEKKFPVVQPTGFVQLHFIQDSSDNAVNNDEFSVHRARAGLKGQLAPQLDFNMIIGAVEPPDRNPHLVNAYVDYKLMPELKIRMGQFLVPFGLEGPEVILFNPAIERSTAVRRLNTLNMFRDAGLELSGSADRFSYAIAAINGTGANNRENNGSQDLIGRVSYSLQNGLTLGVSGHTGSYVSGSDKDLVRFRAGIDFEYIKDGLKLRGEYITRKDDNPAGGDTEMQGWYILGAYRLDCNIEPVVRYEQFDPNTDAGGDKASIITVGGNYYFVGRTRLSLNYEIRDDKADKNLGNLLTLQMQIAF